MYKNILFEEHFFRIGILKMIKKKLINKNNYNITYIYNK